MYRADGIVNENDAEYNVNEEVNGNDDVNDKVNANNPAYFKQTRDFAQRILRKADEKTNTVASSAHHNTSKNTKNSSTAELLAASGVSPSGVYEISADDDSI